MRTWITFILLAVAVMAAAQGLRNPAFIGNLHYVEASEGGAPASSLVTNLVAYWRLDEVSGVRDDVVGTNDLSDVNTVTSTTGIITNGALFTAANTEKLDCLDSPELSTENTSYTLSCWFKVYTTNVSSGIISKYLASGSSREFALVIANQRPNYVYCTNGSAGSAMQLGLSTANRLTTNVWHFVVIMYDSTNKKQILFEDMYAMTNSGIATYQEGGTGNFEIGYSVFAGVYFDGVVDEVGFWRKLLSYQDVTNLYNGGSGITYPFTGKP